MKDQAMIRYFMIQEQIQKLIKFMKYNRQSLFWDQNINLIDKITVKTPYDQKIINYTKKKL